MKPDRVHYTETQPATTLRIVLGGSAFVIIAIAALIPADLQVRLILLSAAAAELLVLFALHSLTIEVRADALELRFGAGLVRRRYPIESIASAALRDWAWWRGSGVRVGFRGTIYLVSRGDVIEIRLVSGWKVFFSCGDGRKLLRALDEAGVPDTDPGGR